MTSSQRSTSLPSPLALFGHPRRCATIPSPVRPSLAPRKPRATRCFHARGCAPHGLPSAAPSSQRMDDDRTGSSHIATLETTPGREQDMPWCLTGARFARAAVNSATLCALPPHVIRTARHDCKPPWPIKGGGGPLAAGGPNSCTLAHFRPRSRYWHFASITPQGLGGSPSSPALLVAPLCKHHSAT
jgi:hypothetical protein